MVSHQAPSAAASGLPALPDHGDHFAEHVFDVADDGLIHLDAFGNAGGIDIDMDDLALVQRKVLGLLNHAVVEPSADGQQHIAMLHGIVGFTVPCMPGMPRTAVGCRDRHPGP